MVDISDSTQVTGGGALDKIVNVLVMKDLKTSGFAKNLIKGVTAAGVVGAGASAVGIACGVAKK